MFEYYSLNDYLKNKFGKKVYKLALDGGFTCPNRDGTLSDKGCIFCSAGGSGEFAQRGESVYDQLQKAKERVSAKCGKDRAFIAYFQSFTNTYGSVEKMRKLFFSVLEDEEVVALSVATRPDCLDEDVLDLLCELNRKIPVWVELGLQTANDLTAQRINRCYRTSVYVEAVKALKAIGVEVITHIIIGLPGEIVEDNINTVRCACDSGTDGVKLHLLHVLKDTALARCVYEPLTMEEYFYRLARCIEALSPRVVIHRLTGDGGKRLLIAPAWSGDKKNVLNSMNRYMNEHNVKQGRCFNNGFD